MWREQRWARSPQAVGRLGGGPCDFLLQHLLIDLFFVSLIWKGKEQLHVKHNNVFPESKVNGSGKKN